MAERKSVERKKNNPANNLHALQKTMELVEERTAKLKATNEQLQREITERKQVEEALRESEQRYRALFESTFDGVFVINAETMRVVLANEAAANIFGFDSAEDTIGINPLDFVSPEDRDRVIRIIAEDMFAKDLRQVNEFRLKGREIEYSNGKTQVIYIGSTRNIRKRLREHLGKNRKNGHIRDFLKNHDCSFRYIQFLENWKEEEKRLFNLFVATYGGLPKCNRVGPIGDS